MGWWHKIVEALAGESPTAPASQAVKTVAPVPTKDGRSAVATLEQPPSAPAVVEQPSTECWWTPEGVTRTEPVELSRPDFVQEALAFENLLISHFDGHNLSMPAIPLILERVLGLLRDPDCSYDKIAEIIAEDQVNAAAVLRMVNSPLYRGNDKITTLKPAITRLGVKALHTLMMHQALKATTFTRRGGLKEFAELLWRRSLAGSSIMRGLAKFTKLNRDDAGLIGLLHDIGSIIVLRLAQTEGAAHRCNLDFEAFEYFCCESHQEFGELVAMEWKLPDKIKSLITDHHAYPAEDDPLRTERLQLQLSDMIDSMIGYGPAASYDLLNTRVVQDLGLAQREDFITFLASLPGELDDMMAAI